MICKNGHEIDYVTTRSRRCHVCVSERRKQYYLNHKEELKLRQEQRLLDPVYKANRNERSRISKQKIRRDGRRNYAHECAMRMNMTDDQYAEYKSAKNKRRIELQMDRLRRSVPKHDEHVRSYRSSCEYHKRKYAAKYQQKHDQELSRCALVKRNARKKVTDWYVATYFKTSLSALPAPLIELGRQIILSRRYLHELKQC